MAPKITTTTWSASSPAGRPQSPRRAPPPGFPPDLSPSPTPTPTSTSPTSSKTSTRESSRGSRPDTPPPPTQMRNNDCATTWQSPPASTSGSGSPRNRSPRAPPERHPTSSPCSPSSNAAPAQSPTSPSKTLGPAQARARRISRIAAKTRRIFLRGKFPAPSTTTTGARWSGPWAPPGSSSRWASSS